MQVENSADNNGGLSLKSLNRDVARFNTVRSSETGRSSCLAKPIATRTYSIGKVLFLELMFSH